MADAVVKQIIEVVVEKSQAERDADARSRAEIKRVNAEAAAAKKAAKEASDEAKKAAKETSDAQKKAAKEASDAAKKAAADTVAAEKETTSEREKADAAYVRAINRKLVAEKQLEAEKERQAAKTHQQWEQENEAIMGTVKSVGMFVAVGYGISGIRSVMSIVAEKFEAIRIGAQRATDEILRQAGKLRPLAALGGQLGRPTREIPGQLELRGLTFQNEDAAREMTTAMMATGLMAVQGGKVTDADLKKFAISQRRLQLMGGASPEAIGNLAGLMPMLTGKKTNTAEDLAALSGRLYDIQKPAGYQDYGQMAAQVGAGSECVMKGVYSAPVMAALMGAFAVVGQGNSAAERLSQVTRAASAGLFRSRGLKIDDAYLAEFQKSSQYFKSLGVTEKNTPEERILAVVGELVKREEETVARGDPFEVIDELQKAGFNNQKDREAIAKLAGVAMSNPKAWEELLRLDHAPLGPSSLAEDRKKTQSDPFVQQQRAEVARDIVQSKYGIQGGVGPFKDVMTRNAYAGIGDQATTGETYGEQMATNWWSPTDRLTGGGPRALEMEAQRRIVDEAIRTGVISDETQFGRWKEGLGMELPHASGQVGAFVGGGNFAGWEPLMRLAEQNRERGGEFSPGLTGEETKQLLTRIADGIDRWDPTKGAPAPPAGGRPAAPAAPPPALPAMPRPQSRTAGP